jgi:plasmid stabilization system protein ParE
MGAARRIQVRATDNFLANLDDLGEFLLQVSPEAAPRLRQRLRDEIDELLTLLETHPGIGRPARFLQARSIQGRERTARATQLAQSLGVGELREYVLKDHLVLYAHSDAAVFLLAVKHQRQLEYEL